MTITGTGIVDWSNHGVGGKSLTLPGGGFNPPERRVRSGDQAQDVPYYTAPEFACHVTTVRLPETTDVKHWSYNSSFDTRMFGRNYYRAFELREGAIRMVRGSRVEQQEIDAALARRDNDRISAFDNSMAKVSYDPAGARAAGQSKGSVPATYEIDWAADNVPCLSSAAGG
jgi:hypothetical protein